MIGMLEILESEKTESVIWFHVIFKKAKFNT